MIIGLASLKGGVGKTTASVCLAEAIAAKGYDVALVDTDPQQGASHWAALAEQQDDALAARVVDAVADFPPEVEADHIVIDTPPNAGPLLREVLAVCDIVVVPTRPGVLDFAEAHQTIAVADELATPVVVLLTGVREGTNSAQEARSFLADSDLDAITFEVPHTERLGALPGTQPRRHQRLPFDLIATQLLEAHDGIKAQ